MIEKRTAHILAALEGSSPLGTPNLDYRTLFEMTSTPLMVLDTELRFITANHCYLGITARKLEDIVGRYVFDVFPETGERLAAIEDSFRRALAGEANSLHNVLFAIERPEGGYQDAWWNCEQQPIFGDNGAIIGVFQHTRDVTAEVTATRMRDVLSQEYDHRVRNMLAKVSAVAHRTAHGARDLEQFVNDFEPRIAAMARAHELLVNGGWEQLCLSELVNGELKPYAGHADGPVTISGPAVTLSSNIAQALGLALHELATNAAKYGALSAPGGHLGVHWSLGAADGALHLVWTETGVPAASVQADAGFGSIIIDRVLPAESGGHVDRRFTDDGLVCTIDIPSPLKT